MGKSRREIIAQIRQQLATNILAGPKPPLDEMCLLSQEYRDVWQAGSEAPVDAILATVFDEPGQWFNKPRTPAEHAFDQETEQLLRKKRWVESEQLDSLARMEKILAGDERWQQRVIEQNRKLNQQIEACQAEAEQATTPTQETAARHRLLKLQKARQTNLKKLAEMDRTQRKVLTATRRNAIDYLGMVRRLEARKEYRKLLRKQERVASGGLGLWGTLGAILAINDFQKMAHGIDKLAKKK
jgi:hypothetical protein